MSVVEKSSPTVKPKKVRADKYETKLSVNASLDELIALSVGGKLKPSKKKK